MLDVRGRVRQLVQRAARGRVVWRGRPDVRRVALTFDDGPQDGTDELLALLDRAGVPATFFVMGLFCEATPARVTEYLRRGHQVGLHGFEHDAWTTLSRAELAAQLDRSERAVGPLPWGRPWVRPPYGKIDARVMAHLLARGHVVGMWSLDSEDYQARDADAVVARCAPGRVRPGDVILFHEDLATTRAALPRIIDGLHGAGYELVTMADLVAT